MDAIKVIKAKNSTYALLVISASLFLILSVFIFFQDRSLWPFSVAPILFIFVLVYFIYDTSHQKVFIYESHIQYKKKIAEFNDIANIKLGKKQYSRRGVALYLDIYTSSNIKPFLSLSVNNYSKQDLEYFLTFLSSHNRKIKLDEYCQQIKKGLLQEVRWSPLS